MDAGASRVEAPSRESARTVSPWMRDILPEWDSWTAVYLHMGEPEGPGASVWAFRRTHYGPPSRCLLADPEWIMHGTVLSLAWKILREGFVVGPSAHSKKGRSVSGMFGIAEGPPGERLELAMARAKPARCTEWREGPSAWSVPVVLALPYGGGHTRLHPLGSEGCYKCAVELPVKSVVRLTDADVLLLLCDEQASRYEQLQSLRDEGALAHVMLCGGRQQWSPQGEVTEPLHWARTGTNMKPSCGRCIPLSCLREGAGAGWWRSEKGKIWFCSWCRGPSPPGSAR